MQPAVCSDWDGHLPASTPYRRIMIGLAAAGVATFAQLYSPQGLLPTLARGLGVSAADAASSVSLATLGVAVSVLGWSWVADRIGRLAAMKIALTAAATIGLLVALAPGLQVLLALRFAEGVALGGLPALAITYLHEEVNARHTAAAAAAYIAGTSIGGAGGRLLAGPLASLFGWRVALAAVAVICALAALLFLRLMPPPRGHVGRKTSAAAVLRGAGIHLRDPGAIILIAQPFLLMGAFVAVYNYLTFRLEGPEFGLPATVVALSFAAYGAGTVSSRLTGSWVPRFGRLAVLLAGSLTFVAGSLLTLASALPVVVAGLVLLTAGFFAAHATATSWITARAVAARSQAGALYNVGLYSGSALVGWLVGYVWDGAGWGAVVAVVVALAGCAIALAVLGRGALSASPARDCSGRPDGAR